MSRMSERVRNVSANIANIITASGLPHLPSFVCTVKVQGYTAIGSGATKKEAKHEAATKLGQILGLDIESGGSPNNWSKNGSIKDDPKLNYVGLLNERCSMNKLMYPIYSDGSMYYEKSCYQQFSVECTFLEHTTEGVGYSKKEAKQDAARKMLAILKTKNIDSYAHNITHKTTVEESPSFEVKILDKVIERYGKMLKNVTFHKSEEDNNDPELDHLKKESVKFSMYVLI
ncbi:hypothetical protein ABEB36_012710 [Hypothenemus hampei]|uniref:DRBM domain-containing protein n=1 Tax=Hypothenemus hampei TaxID=57062 RepID=A0ABD1EC50_HYPHA